MSATSAESMRGGGVSMLTLGALGVVYGDIGTSPLYTMKEVLSPANGVVLGATTIVGAVSAIIWALVVIVTLKYVVLILRADNRGEGGILALTALAVRAVGDSSAWRRRLLLTGICGAALFYGDSVITPAISVLGAVEGLELIAPELHAAVVPISLGVLIGLFAMQRYGTARMGKLFGPVMLLWFLVLAASGLHQIIAEPSILLALNPLHGLRFLQEMGWSLLVVLGAVVLALTGAEALYADLGHFGKRPIRLAWTGLVFPSLAINYAGQGALLLRDPTALENPFFRLFPAEALVPAVVLATMASVIASQAVISGAFSLTKEAIQLGLLPRTRVIHTSDLEVGQVYLPAVNWVLLVAVVLAVLGFESSSSLASAYGIAVTITMLITTVLTFFVVRYAWNYSRTIAWLATLGFMVIDALLVLACSLKVMQGGWFPLALGSGLFLVMATWMNGRDRLHGLLREDSFPIQQFLAQLDQDPRRVHVAPRIAVYPTQFPDATPSALLHNLKHYHAIHEQNILVTVVVGDVPRVPLREQLQVESLTHGFWRVRVEYGFKDELNVPAALGRCAQFGLQFDPYRASYFLSKEVIVPTRPRSRMGMSRWRLALFTALARNGSGAADYFRLPDNCVIELGARVQL